MRLRAIPAGPRHSIRCAREGQEVRVSASGAVGPPSGPSPSRTPAVSARTRCTCISSTAWPGACLAVSPRRASSSHDLSKACLTVTLDAIPRVVLLGRLAVYGPRAARLHEEIRAGDGALDRSRAATGRAHSSYGRTGEQTTLVSCRRRSTKQAGQRGDPVRTRLAASAQTDNRRSAAAPGAPRRRIGGACEETACRTVGNRTAQHESNCSERQRKRIAKRPARTTAR